MKNTKYVKYTVRKNDTLWAIARKHRTHWRKLAKLNRLDNPHLIYVGQTILVPDAHKREKKAQEKPYEILKIVPLYNATYKYHCMIRMNEEITYVFANDEDINDTMRMLTLIEEALA